MDKAAGRAVEVAGAALGWAAAPGVEEDRVEAVKVAAAGEETGAGETAVVMKRIGAPEWI